jgi:hypothetical protein
MSGRASSAENTSSPQPSGDRCGRPLIEFEHGAALKGNDAGAPVALELDGSSRALPRKRIGLIGDRRDCSCEMRDFVRP